MSIKPERYPTLMQLLWEIKDGKRTEFCLELEMGERPDHFDSRVNSFGAEHNLRLDHRTCKGRLYQVYLIEVVPRGTQPNHTNQ